MDSKKTLRFVVYGFVILTFIMNFASDITDLVRLGDIVKSDTKDFLVASSVIDLIATIIILVISSIGLLKSYRCEKNDRFLIGSIFTYTLVTHALLGLTISFNKSQSHGTLVLSGVGIAVLIFSIFAFVALCIALFLSGFAKKTALLLGIVFYFIYMLISLLSSNSTSSTSVFPTITMAFLFISLLLTIISIFISDDCTNDSVKKTSLFAVQTETKKPSIKNDLDNPKVEKDPYEQLKQLKKLYDDKIITKAEYDAKKKKYIDKL